MVVLIALSTCTAKDEIIINVNSISVVTNVNVNDKANDVVYFNLQITAEMVPENAVCTIFTKSKKVNY